MNFEKLADDLIRSVREHVTARLAPLLVRQESADQIANDHDRRIAELERRLAEIEAKAATLRRVA